MALSSERRAVALFSGGLDSILAAKLVQEQGVTVTGLHFVSPFFGKPEKTAHWESLHGLPIRAIDISAPFAQMLARRPVHGFGSVINPCVDCKILMLRHARIIMEEMDACCIISGEVLGQRPMSQRRDTLNIIRRDAGVRDCLLRPLSALHLDPIQAELDGLIDRAKLLGISGRGRKDQMALAERFGLKEIPAPAGGCRLTEKENARSYWPVLLHSPSPSATDFHLANTGRQYWHDHEPPPHPAFWLIIGRNQQDNDALMALAGEKDLLFKPRDFPGPIALGRFLGGEWSAQAAQGAAAFVASYSPKCMRHAENAGGEAAVRVHPGSLDAPGHVLTVTPSRHPPFAWREYTWPEACEAIRAERKG